ncbi:unnamed protein product [Scytosiphon promiscuus]
MARKDRKKKGRNKRRVETLTAVKDVVTKATKSKKIMRLWRDTVLQEEVVDLRSRLEKAHNERGSLRKRIAEREDQQEAVFDTLKERVIVAQAEIQTLMAETEANDRRRRREHDETQMMLEGRIDDIDFQRDTATTLQLELQDKDKAFDRLNSELQTVVAKNEELLREQERLEHVEETLCTFRRKFAVLSRVDASEEKRSATANDGHRQKENGLTTGKDNIGGDTKPTARATNVLGLGFVPLLMEGMAHFPTDVKLTRDALALLGYVASTEPLGRTFLTTHGLYREVMAALRRHVTDNMVALHAARLLHKSALQGEATTIEMRAEGIIPLLAEALAAASYSPKGARTPRRLLYHAFATIRRCYPSDFFGESLLALGLQQKNKQYANEKIQRSRYLERRQVGGTASLLDPRSLGGHHQNIDERVLAARPKLLPSLPREELYSKADRRDHPEPLRRGETNHDRHLPLESISSLRQADRYRAGWKSGEANGSGYWDTLGGEHEACGRSRADVPAEQSELAESAVASAVLLRWATEAHIDNCARDDCEDSDDLPVTGGRGEGAAAGRKPSSMQEMVGGTIPSPLRLTTWPGESSVSRMWSGSGSGRTRATHDQHDSSIPTEKPGNACATTSSRRLEGSRNRNLEGTRKEQLACHRLQASGGEQRERRTRAGGDEVGAQRPERDRRQFNRGDVVACCPSKGEETASAASADEARGGRRSRVIDVLARATGEKAGEAKRTEETSYDSNSPESIALHALVCLLRAAEVDLCGDGNTGSPEPSAAQLHIDPAGGGRAVMMEQRVLVLVLRACSTFQHQGDAVKACCMLMRAGVRCSLHGGGPERPAGGSLTPSMVILIKNGVEGIVTTVATTHIDDPSVTAEASALLRCLGIHMRTVDEIPAVSFELPPPLLSRPSMTSMPIFMVGSVTIDATTKASTDMSIRWYR